MAEELEEYEISQAGMIFTVQLTASTAKRMGLVKPEPPKEESPKRGRPKKQSDPVEDVV